MIIVEARATYLATCAPRTSPRTGRVRAPPPRPPAATGYAIAVIALLTAFILWIAFRTVLLAVRGQLFPAWPPLTRQ